MLITRNPGTRYEHAGSLKRTDPHRHKYLSAMAEYLDLWCELDWHGDVECLTGAYALAGRRIVITNDQGFVWVEQYDTPEGARIVFDLLERYYSEWGDEEAEEAEPAERLRRMAEIDRELVLAASQHKRWGR